MTLIDRLSKLDGPDREEDAEIAKSVGGLKANREFGMGGNWWDRWTDGGLTVGLPAYTASVDAAIALAERVQPYSIMVLFNDAFIWLHARYRPENHSKMLPIALCTALLRAREVNR
ncbi:hypothetical protein [Ochrobactrum sp. EDr1-4]|uniref:hypothetical protein n=1 Tax=Ochrobactrum sp. EDr1-4 TaxID=3368622 RepID=UPI003BA26F0C